MRTNKRVRAIVTRDNQILLIHRKRDGEEYWVVPGGGVEDDETTEQGLIREVKEETSLDVNKFILIGTSREKEIEHYYYLCELSEGEPVLGGPEAEENNESNWYNLEWVNKDLINNLDLYPGFLKQITGKIWPEF